MRRDVARLGDAAALVWTTSSVEAQLLATAIREQSWTGVEDVVPAADSVGLLVDPVVAEPLALAERAAALPAAGEPEAVPRTHLVEVRFDGPDLGAVAEALAVTPEEVIRLLERARLRVGWLGFMPGFGYLEGLPEPLRLLPRLGRPRSRVEPGSLAVGGGMAGIYPFATPGGWNVLGRTAVRPFDADAPPFALLRPGDIVSIRAVESIDVPAAVERPPVTAEGPNRAIVVDAGFQTTVQDAGRIGVAHLGVPRAGAADRLRHHIANAAVGNEPDAPCLEITIAGPVMRFEWTTFVALAGDAPLSVDGRQMPPGVVVPIGPGNVVGVGRLRSGARAYLGVAGGITGGRHFGSWSADTATELPPSPLRPGDELSVGAPGRARGRFEVPPVLSPFEVHVIAGPDASAAAALEALLSRTWRVEEASNRTGLRLSPADAGGSIGTEGASVPSRATATGLVQLPPDGNPIVLGPDHGTVGGYPVVAAVTAPGRSLLGQAKPGDELTFRLSDGADTVPESIVVDKWFPEPS